MSDEALRLYVRYCSWFDRTRGLKGYRAFPIEDYKRRGQHIAATINLETVVDE